MSKRRNLLTEDELRIATKTTFVTTDEAAFKFFYEDCHLKNLRPHTIKYYRENLHYKAQPLVSLIERDLKQMIVEMKEKGLKTATINAKLRALRSFYNFLYKNKRIKKNPMANVKLLKERKEGGMALVTTLLFDGIGYSMFVTAFQKDIEMEQIIERSEHKIKALAGLPENMCHEPATRFVIEKCQ